MKGNKVQFDFGGIVILLWILMSLFYILNLQGCEETNCNDVCGEICNSVNECLGKDFPYEDVEDCCDHCVIEDGSKKADCIHSCYSLDSCQAYIDCIYDCNENQGI